MGVKKKNKLQKYFRENGVDLKHFLIEIIIYLFETELNVLHVSVSSQG